MARSTPARIYRTVIPPPPPRTYSTSKYFHIFYTTLFYLLYTALLGLILVTPGDAIRQALQNKQLYNVFVIAAAYFVTAFLAGLIYASRIYTTRSVLSAIPRGYVPVEEGDVKEKVRRVVKRGLGRSAGVAWLARPRTMQCAQGTNALCLAEEIEERREHSKEAKPKLAKRVLRILRRKNRKSDKKTESRRGSNSGAEARRVTACTDNFGHPVVCPMPGHQPAGDTEEDLDHGTHIWGHISHPGWSPPTSHDLPNLQYHAVIAELPHLVEAKVVALSGATEENLGLLTRMGSRGLREYLLELVEFGCLDAGARGNGVVVVEGEEEDTDEDEDDRQNERGVRWKEWLTSYEHARFSGEAVSEEAFRELMSGFASLLRSIRGLGGQMAAEEDDASDWDEGEAYSVHSKSTKSTRSGEQSLHSQRSQQSFQTMDDRRSILTTGTAGTAGTVEKRENIEPQVPSYLSSPLPQTYTPGPRTPSPRPPSDRLSSLEEVESHDYQPSMGYEMQDMANTPESVIKRSPRPAFQGQENVVPEMRERVRLGVNGGIDQADTDSLGSFETDSEGGSVIRLEMTGTREQREDNLVDRLQAPLQVRLPGSRNTSSRDSYHS